MDCIGYGTVLLDYGKDVRGGSGVIPLLGIGIEYISTTSCAGLM